MNHQLEESEQIIADFDKRNIELEEQLSVVKSQVHREKDGGAKVKAVDRTSFKLKWRRGEKAPCEMFRSCDAVVSNNTVYCKYYDMNSKIYCYHIPSSSWSPIPDGLTNRFAIAVVDDLLTIIGGYGLHDYYQTYKLFSLTGVGSRRRWTEIFPPMPTKRSCVSALCSYWNSSDSSRGIL